MKFLGLSLLFLVLALAAVAYIYIWPNLSGNWVKKMDRSHPELVFSKYKIGDPISKLPRPLIAIEGSPSNPTRANCEYYSLHVDGLPEPCKHIARNGLVYESNGLLVEGVILRLNKSSYLRPLPFGIMPSESPEQIIARFNRSSLAAEVIFRVMGVGRPRLVGWQIDKQSEYTDSRFAWVEFDDQQNMTAIGVSYI